MNPQFSELIQQLGEAISDALSESEEVRRSIGKLESIGCKVAIMIGAEVHMGHRSDQLGTFSAEDVKFASALKIKLD